jgi:arsenate reductase (thioredoxin)
MEKARVLFLCTHNSARSQMAEGMLRNLAGDRFEVMSAGTETTHVRPLVIRVMDEIGIDISGQESKTLDRYLTEPFDCVITVYDDANGACPFFPGPRAGCTGPSRTPRGPKAPRRSAWRSSVR